MTGTIPAPVSWCCTDCLMVLANGEYPMDITETELAEYKSRIDATLSGGTEVTIGMLVSEHEDDCPVNIEGSYNAVDECSCTVQSFSWSDCELCDSNLGGERHAITFWIPDADYSPEATH
jgi:hypothetical protein